MLFHNLTTPHIFGTGLDVAAVDRFTSWVTNPSTNLSKVFTEREITAYHKELGDLRLPPNTTSTLPRGSYAGLTPPDIHRRASYIAARFAAKEAFYKALSCTLLELRKTSVSFSFLFACKHVEVIKEEVWAVPQYVVDWRSFESKLGTKLPSLTAHLSLSHEKEYAFAHALISH